MPHQRGRPTKSAADYRQEFEDRFGKGSVERFVKRCQEGTLQEVGSTFAFGAVTTTWKWYCRLTGKKGKHPRANRAIPPVLFLRGGKPGQMLRPDVTAGQIQKLLADGLSKSRVARVLKISRQTLYQRLGKGHR